MLKNTFCSSPWFHVRVESDGEMHYCRWAPKQSTTQNIKNIPIKTYFNSSELSSIRAQMLDGTEITSCSLCYDQDKVNKISGRARQLCKSGIDLDHFEQSIASSPHYGYFNFSAQNSGKTNSELADLQIDLGNYCNSECIMCSPRFSAKLGNTYKKLNWLDPKHNLYRDKFSGIYDWTSDKTALQKFITELSQMPELRYIHLLGGETLAMPSFYAICQELIKTGINEHITLGLTTNGTIWRDDLKDLLSKFQSVNLGISIETTHPVNDYIRYPGNITEIKTNILKFKELSLQSPNISIQLRTTPNALSVWHLDDLIKFQLEHKLYSESCHILMKPEWLQFKVLPVDLRAEAAKKLLRVLPNSNITNNPNARHSEQFESALIQDTLAIIKLLEQPVTEDIPLKQKLVQFLHELESIRHNKILDYLPDYEQFLRHYGY
jgi:MoaA/NifB/PqqE/SkfB family radical SAM enzyme